MNKKFELTNRTLEHYASLDVEPIREMIPELEKFWAYDIRIKKGPITSTEALQRCCLYLAYLSYKFIVLYTNYFGGQKDSAEERLEEFEHTLELLTRVMNNRTELRPYVDHMVQARDCLAPLLKASLKQRKGEAETDATVRYHLLHPISQEDFATELFSLGKLSQLMFQLLYRDEIQGNEPFLSFVSWVFSIRCNTLMNCYNITPDKKGSEVRSLSETGATSETDSSTSISSSSSSNANNLDESNHAAPIPPSSETSSVTTSPTIETYSSASISSSSSSNANNLDESNHAAPIPPSSEPSSVTTSPTIDVAKGSCFASATPCLSSEAPTTCESHCVTKPQQNSPLPSPSTTSSQPLEKDEGTSPRFTPSEQQDTMLDCVESHQVENSMVTPSSEEKADIPTGGSNSEGSKITRMPRNKPKNNDRDQSLQKPPTRLPANRIWDEIRSITPPQNPALLSHALETTFFRHRCLLGLIVLFIHQQDGKSSLTLQLQMLIKKTRDMTISCGADVPTRTQIQELSNLLQSLTKQSKGRLEGSSFAFSLPTSLASTRAAYELVQKVLNEYILPITREIGEKQDAMVAGYMSTKIRRLVNDHKCNSKYASIVKEHFEFKLEYMNKNSPFTLVESTTTPANQ